MQLDIRLSHTSLHQATEEYIPFEGVNFFAVVFITAHFDLDKQSAWRYRLCRTYGGRVFIYHLPNLYPLVFLCYNARVTSGLPAKSSPLL